jgi:integrase
MLPARISKICTRPGIWSAIQQSFVIRIHDLRHSFASMAADAGASLPMIGGLLGHADPQTTARYVHLVDKQLHELNVAVDKAIGAAMTGRNDSKASKNVRLRG